MLIFLTIINLIGLLLAQLRVWRPITFKKLAWFNANYPCIATIPVITYVMFVFIRKHKYPPSLEQISNTIYTDDYQTLTRREYFFNWLAFIIHQIILNLIF